MIVETPFFIYLDNGAEKRDDSSEILITLYEQLGIAVVFLLICACFRFCDWQLA